ncbi:hypothetical protein [Armatimonas sp.]|uniref:hypothetical protein n=1 Tax=Armatimonas sp. TaxID=1872638 RepID=UPI00286BFCF1|nr:hypothetical protein [Armatimonas sp.]
MLRRHYRALLFLSALVLAASLMALRAGYAVARIPQDMGLCEGDGPWLISANEQPLPDGSGRRLQLMPGGLYRLVHTEEAVATHINKPTGHLLGITPTLRAVVYEPGFPTLRPKNPAVAAITTFGIGERELSLKTSTLRLPKTVQTLEDAVLSPQGTQIAWFLTSSYDRPGVATLGRFFPGLAERFPPHRVLEIWVSDAKGDHLHNIAAAPAPSAVISIGWSQKTGKLMVAYQGKHYRLR